MPKLEQTRREMWREAQRKSYVLAADIVQSFRIAGLSDQEAATCVGKTFLRMAVTFALQIGMPQDKWMRACASVFDLAETAHKEHP